VSTSGPILEPLRPDPEPTGNQSGSAGSQAQRGHHSPTHTHRDVSSGWLRASVFGAMDGLVSNVSLISGVAGGSAGASTIRLAGIAGLFAGAFSMAAGEFTSVQSQNEATTAEIDSERRELARAPRAEAAELTRLYRSRGVDPDLASEVVRQLSRDNEVALRIHVREELGVDVDSLPSPWVAAGSSFVAFAIGALIPLLPYLLGASVLWISLLVSAVALFATGAVVSRFTNRTPVFSGARQLLLGVAAAAITYGLGQLVGAAQS
jgi:VIT1/CCC1 family predicted Fe2+/Mn2+ transporter